MKQSDVKKLTEALESFCKDHGARFTPPRRITLEIIARHERPIGAYDVIEEMGRITDKPKPTTVYRALEFLQAHGFIHKIESLSAFTACHAGHSHEGSQFIVCNGCGTVEEVHVCHLPQALQKKVEETGFKMAHWNTEIHGTCLRCQRA